MLNPEGHSLDARNVRPAGPSLYGWTLGSLGTFSLSLIAGLGLTMNATFVESFSSARLGALLGALLLLHLMRFPSFVITREARLYALFVAYMVVQLLWTQDKALALNTLVPAIAFLLVLVLYASLLADHDERSVLAGTLAGFLLGAAIYTAVTRFPFAYPAGFSYNSIAQMYLFGLVVSLILASHGRMSLFYVSIASVVLVHIMATTSIKTNLGIMLGGMAAVVFYRRYFARVVRRNAAIFALLVGGLAYVVLSNVELIETVRRGLDRVELGIEVLQARENIAGYSGFERRSAWQQQGLSGWSANPVFGYGVEAFRSKYDITSHSTVVDLLYNSGFIGFVLFYGTLVSVALRLYRADDSKSDALRATILALGICYVFMTLAGNIHYSSFLAAFIAFSTATLSRRTVAA